MSRYPLPRAAYLHVPFCAHRCGYCDFTLVAGKDHLIDDYLRAMQIELPQLGERRTIDTLFIGGGTPTHLDVDRLSELLRLLAQWFELAEDAEFSTEANPTGLTTEKIALLADHGCNRISLGVQSFESTHLQTLERDHSPLDVAEVVDDIRRHIDNFSLDLIFGVPGQTISDWEKTLQAAIDLDPQHVSTYGLTFEKGTDYWSRREHGDLIPVADDVEREMYLMAMQSLPAAGYEQYELSNFAQPTYACRHNQTYWQGGQYWGFGPGAASYLDGVRRTNHRSVTTWLQRVLRGETAIAEEEELAAEDRARETVMLGLRQTAGINQRVFQQQTGFELEALAPGMLQELIDRGLLELRDDHVRLTIEGRCLADTVITEFL